MPFTTYLANTMLNEVFGGVGYTPVANVYVGLSTTAPAVGGTNITEPSGNGYTRVTIANNTTNWPNASSGSTKNGTPITFPTATGAWGTVAYFFIADAASGTTNILAYGTLNVSKTVTSGDTLSFATNALTITLS